MIPLPTPMSGKNGKPKCTFTQNWKFDPEIASVICRVLSIYIKNKNKCVF